MEQQAVEAVSVCSDSRPSLSIILDTTTISSCVCAFRRRYWFNCAAKNCSDAFIIKITLLYEKSN